MDFALNHHSNALTFRAVLVLQSKLSLYSLFSECKMGTAEAKTRSALVLVFGRGFSFTLLIISTIFAINRGQVDWRASDWTGFHFVVLPLDHSLALQYYYFGQSKHSPLGSLPCSVNAEQEKALNIL